MALHTYRYNILHCILSNGNRQARPVRVETLSASNAQVAVKYDMQLSAGIILLFQGLIYGH